MTHHLYPALLFEAEVVPTFKGLSSPQRKFICLLVRPDPVLVVILALAIPLCLGRRFIFIFAVGYIIVPLLPVLRPLGSLDSHPRHDLVIAWYIPPPGSFHKLTTTRWTTGTTIPPSPRRLH